MTCSWTSPWNCVGPAIHSVVGGAKDIASSAWDDVCRSFASAATELLNDFAHAFAAIPDVSLTTGGVRSVYAISLGLAGAVAILLLLGQVIRTALTGDGSAIAQGFIGVAKAGLAFLCTLTVGAAALLAADELTTWIINASFGSTAAFAKELSVLVSWDPSDVTSVTLIFVLAVIGIVLVVVLWFEMLLRNAAIAVLIATSPIAAAGQVAQSTSAWWQKLCTTTVQLIILKPLIALVFALGMGLAGHAQSLNDLLVGMLVLFLAAVAWPALARFMVFSGVSSGGMAGLGTALGFAAGHLSNGQGTSGVDPNTFSQSSEQRTMARSDAAGGEASGGSSGGEAGGAGAVAGAGGAVLAGAGMAVKAAIKGANSAASSLASHMDHTASHAGLHPGAYHAPAPRGRSAGTIAAQRGAGGGEAGAEADGGPPTEPLAPVAEPDDPGIGGAS